MVPVGRVLAEADASTVAPAGVSGRDGSQPAKGVFLVLCFPFGMFPAPASTIKRAFMRIKSIFYRFIHIKALFSTEVFLVLCFLQFGGGRAEHPVGEDRQHSQKHGAKGCGYQHARIECGMRRMQQLGT